MADREPDLSGAGFMGGGNTPYGSTPARGMNVGANFKFDTSQLTAAKAAVGELQQAVTSLKEGLAKVDLTKFTSDLAKMTTTATTAANAMRTVGTGFSGMTGAGGGGNTNGGVQTGGGSGIATGGASIAAAGGGAPPGGIDLSAAMIGSGSGGSFVKDLALFPLRFMQERIQNNRQTVLDASGALSMTAFGQNAGIQQMLGTMSKFPGNIQGTPSDLIGMFSQLGKYGASYNFGGGPNGVRAAGMMSGIQQAQMLNPAASVGQITQSIGGYASNVQAQQQSMMLTGGAFSMIGAGGRQKNIQEWAESILRWLENLRGGGDRGKPFDYGQLIAQQFPGSNIDAWFTANGVPQDMRDYWWTYALGKASRTGSTQGGFTITPDSSNLSTRRLRAATELTRTEFGLGSQMAGAYANKEQANQWFNATLGKQLQKTIPSAVSNGPLSLVQYLPDTIENLLMTAIERGGGLGTAFGAALGYGGGITGLLGDIGDPAGSYGAMGGTTLSGTHPDVRRKVGAMMRANPNLRITSGLRDTALQKKLRAQGYTNVSGKPSGHTRGTEVDLGPRSQYGWIAQNAGKFGLNSGAKQGEPWHVGIGDTDGVGDMFTDLIGLGGSLSGLMDLIRGGDSMDAMSKIMPGVINMLFGVLGGAISGNKPVNQANLAFRPDFIDKLQSVRVTAGLPGFVQNALSGTSQVGQVTKADLAAMQAQQLHTRAGSDIMSQFTGTDKNGLPGTVDPTGAGVAAALYRAGFRGQDLINFASLGKRESGWDRAAHKGPDSQDDSFGLFQFNLLPWEKKSQAPPYTGTELTDPQTAAYAARWQFNQRGMQPWTINGDWSSGVNLSNGQSAVAAAQRAGMLPSDIGDIGYMPMPMQSGGNTITIHAPITIQAPMNGSNGGMDLRRTADVLASHVVKATRQQLARNN